MVIYRLCPFRYSKDVRYPLKLVRKLEKAIMSREHPEILYVGDMEQGRALAAAAEAREWYVHTPGETMEALAIYATFFPDIVVIDTLPRVTLAHEVYYHLRSVNAEPMLVLADDRQPGWWGDFDIHL